MLRLLLDEHITPKVSEQLVARQPSLQVVPMINWNGGAHLGSTDEVLLAVADQQGLTLATYDLRTISPLLKRMAEQGVSHSGVIFIDTKTYMPNDIGGLVLALEAIWLERKDEDWRGRVVYVMR